MGGDQRDPRVPSVGACLALALLVATAGLCLRLAVPVTPPDENTRAVLRLYEPHGDIAPAR